MKARELLSVGFRSAAACWVLCAVSVAQLLERASVSATGGDANGVSSSPALSGDGRYVAFASTATNLVAIDANGPKSDVFVRDRLTQTTALVSLSTLGTQVAQDSTLPSMSSDGRYVAFTSIGLDPAQVSFQTQIFVRDLGAGTTQCPIPVDNFAYDRGQLSADGRVLCYVGEAYVASQQWTAIRTRDLPTGTVTSAVDAVVNQVGNGWKLNYIQFSGDGRFVDYRHNSVGFGGGVSPLKRLQVGGSTTTLIASAYPLDVSHDGRITLYETTSDGQSWILDNSTGTSSPLGNHTTGSSNSPVTSAATSKDGTYVAFTHLAHAYLRERTSGLNAQLDLGVGGQQANTPVQQVALSSDATVAAFSSTANNLVAGDANGVGDVFVRSIVRGASYCTSSTTTNGCAPVIAATGLPSLNLGSNYVVSVQQVEGQRSGLIYYGLAALAAPWATGSSSTMCVAPPRQRTTLLSSGGTDGSCDGAFALDLFGWLAAHPGALGTPLQAGLTLYLQGQFRDPAAPKGSNLSDGLSVTLWP